MFNYCIQLVKCLIDKQFITSLIKKMDKKDIADRADIKALIVKFYSKVGNDNQLGPIFNKHLVSEEVWKDHFETLTNFWEAVLFKGNNYQGQVVAQHIWVDSQSGRTLKDDHFKNWLDIWHETIDETFAGPTAEIAKSSGISLAQTFYSKIMEVRKSIDPSGTIKKNFDY